MDKKRLSRRSFLKLTAGAAAGAAMAACQPQTVVVEKEITKEVEKIVKETVVVEKEVVKKEPVTLNYLNRGGDYIWEVMDQQIAGFNKEYPDITIEQNSVVGSQHQELLLMMIAAGTGPDCWFDGARTTGMLTHKGVTTDLEPFLAADPKFKEEDYWERAWISGTFFGKRWGLPWDSGCMALAFNLELFDEAGVPYLDPKEPMTWDDFVQVATQLTLDFDGKHPDESGFDPSRVKQYGFSGYLGHGMNTYLYSNGAEIIEADMSCPIDTPEAIEAFQWLADLGIKYFVGPSGAYPQASEMSLRSKNIAIEHAGVWSLGRFNDSGLNWGTAPVPMKKVPASYGHYAPMCIFSKSKHKQEAYDFAFWCCCSHEGEQILVDTGTQQPIRKDLQERFLDNPNPPERKYRQVFVDAFDPQTFRYPGDKIGSYYGGWRQGFLDLWNPILDAVWSGKTQYAEIATELREKTEYLLETGEVT